MHLKKWPNIYFARNCYCYYYPLYLHLIKVISLFYESDSLTCRLKNHVNVYKFETFHKTYDFANDTYLPTYLFDTLFNMFRETGIP